MGRIPNAAPKPAVAKAMPAGILKNTIATTSAVISPSNAAQWALMCKKARVPNNTTTGNAAKMVEIAMLLNGS